MVIFYSYVSLPEGICRFKSPSRRLAPAVAPRRLPSMPSPVYDLGRRRRKEQPGALPDDHKNCGFLWSLRLTWWIFGKILDILVKTCKDPKKMNPKKHIPGLQLKMKPVEFWKMQQLFLKAGWSLGCQSFRPKLSSCQPKLQTRHDFAIEFMFRSVLTRMPEATGSSDSLTAVLLYGVILLW